jgi:peptide/nickel transport system substrate-binding protein
MKTHASRHGALAMVLLLLTSACGREKAAPTVDGETPVSGGVAVVAEGADINSPILLLVNTELDGALAADVMNMSLLRWLWEDGELVYRTADQSPVAMARSFEYFGPDSTAIRFHMRSDLLWSDGKPITAEDVRFTYRLLKDPRLNSPVAGYAERIDSVVVENDSTLAFHFQDRYPEMLADASIPPVPEHVYGDTPAAELRTHPTIIDPSGGKLVVSGPWMISEWRKGQQVTLVPNPNFKPQPHLSRIVFRIIPDATTRLVELQTGGVDLVKNVPADKIDLLKADPNIRLEREQKRVYDYIAYNGSRFAPFADREIRRALTLAIDPQRLIRGLQLEEVAVPAGGPFSPIYKIYDPELMPPVKADTAEARRILASKGWTDSDGDGTLDRGGVPFRFTLLTSSGNPRRADVSLLIQQMWKQIGVDARLQQLELNTFTSERLLKHDFQAAVGTWSQGLTPDFLKQLYGTGEPFNATGYSNAKVDSLMAVAQHQATEPAAAPYWQKAAIQITEDQPNTWLYYFDGVDAVRNRLKGVRIDTFGTYQNTWEWWIPRSQQGRAASAQPDSAR